MKKIIVDDSKWLVALPDGEFTTADAGQAWNVYHERAWTKLALLREAGLVESRLLGVWNIWRKIK